MPRPSAPSVLCLVIAIAALVCWAPPSPAEWSKDGNEVALSYQSPFFHQVCPDGEGGIFVVRANAGNVVVNRMDAHGRPVWSPATIDVSSASGYHAAPQIIPDGTGGAIVAFRRDVDTEVDIWAQRIDASGNLLWGAEGDSICTMAGSQYNMALVSDGSGGAIIAWEDYRGADADIYVQRIDASGALRWTAGGVALCTATGNQMFPRIVTDMADGAIVGWHDDRGGFSERDVYAQHVFLQGAVDGNWAADGNALCSASGMQGSLDLISDGAAGAIGVWEDHRAGEQLYAQRIGHYGAIQWAANGVQLCTAAGGQSMPRMVGDGSGGAVVCWVDSRVSPVDVYAQRFDAAGVVQWAATGVAICTAAGVQTDQRLTSDGAGGAIITWTDSRAVHSDVYAQRVASGGSVAWTANGLPLCTVSYPQFYPEIASDGEGGAIAVWCDYRGDVVHVYAQRVERNGYWGYPAGYLASCADVPGDQGGLVNLAWYASRLDPWPDLAISHYSLWRAIESSAAMAAIDGGSARLVAPEAVDEGAIGPVVRSQVLAGRTFFWELVGTQDAYHLSGYSKTVATLFDSTATDGRFHYFQTIAHATDPAKYWISLPDSGYSVDNLAPAQPAGLAGILEREPAGIALSWRSNTEQDLSHYALYRGPTADFTPDAGTFVAAVGDTQYFDNDGYGAPYYYKLFALDIHGNASPFALLPPEQTADVVESGALPGAWLAQSAPNPFMGSHTRIAFSLAAAADVSLRLYDTAGHLVRTLVQGRLGAGPQSVLWDGCDAHGHAAASGVYYYRLVTGGRVWSRRLVRVQ